MPQEKSQYEDYLGDGLYADYDGWQIVLSANDRNSGHPTARVYLEPLVIVAFLRYIERIKESG